METQILQTENTEFYGKGNNTDKVGLNKSARGLYGPCLNSYIMFTQKATPDRRKLNRTQTTTAEE